ncbi:DUF6514 family protein [Anaeropeptidivorans aminofermentans]|uniref:DUF6514 family protein n=1 Tax=Anaeropeptidivorans aminofermentans TaxID=2934315 RepID=UPI002023CC8B|nr:DUF6514 family protein [Anaeropeptidivorans aminofermentans]MBE6011887.1 hypothetical protein [Lachnospiraceae bacterium]
MFQKNIVRSSEAVTCEGKEILLVYSLIAEFSDTMFSNESPTGLVFGVSVEKYAADCQYSKFEESEVVKKITYDKNFALSLIDILADNTVTPMSLINIIDDLVSEVIDTDSVSYSMAN